MRKIKDISDELTDTVNRLQEDKEISDAVIKLQNIIFKLNQIIDKKI